MSEAQPMTMPFVNTEIWLKEHTHGHVMENAHARVANCMGPAECETCRVELELKRLIDASREASGPPVVAHDASASPREELGERPSE
ncbi:hypothetical protein Pan44_26580 [Caulifigura coniformis]|uniref:Uncharacterized protein n=1 Tax=Caulifigura coniformis TaxID=2527983 RepID=A0A517SEQ9_9PLAN|nr:hypothetical protein Pan44_26580 [Caulifigura coniformis]